MTPEIYTILAVAIALAGLILNGQRAIGELRRDLNALSDRVHGDIAALGERVNGDIAALNERVHTLNDRVHGDIAALGQRVSRVEGLLEGIRDSIRERAA